MLAGLTRQIDGTVKSCAMTCEIEVTSMQVVGRLSRIDVVKAWWGRYWRG